MNPFAAAIAKSLPSPIPAHFDLKVSQLGKGRAAAVALAVNQGELNGFIYGGELWVRRAELEDLMAPGHSTYDRHDSCCFIPSGLVAR
jgi:hypothetical protein